MAFVIILIALLAPILKIPIIHIRNYDIWAVDPLMTNSERVEQQLVCLNGQRFTTKCTKDVM